MQLIIQLYLHSFIFSKDGEWTVIQQDMNESSRMAHRYHWYSINTIHFAIIGYYDKQRAIKNITGLLHKIEKDFVPNPDHFEKYIAKEVRESKHVGGLTVFDDKKDKRQNPIQLKLF